MRRKRHFPFAVVCLLASTLLAACIKVYRTDVQQGNVVTQEMVETLKLGMTRNQVRFVLGTPLLTDPFHDDRWDYFYLFKKGGAQTVETRRVTVLFDQDRLIGVDGDIPATQLKEATDPQPLKEKKPEPDTSPDESRPAS